MLSALVIGVSLSEVKVSMEVTTRFRSLLPWIGLSNSSVAVRHCYNFSGLKSDTDSRVKLGLLWSLIFVFHVTLHCVSLLNLALDRRLLTTACTVR